MQWGYKNLLFLAPEVKLPGREHLDFIGSYSSLLRDSSEVSPWHMHMHDIDVAVAFGAPQIWGYPCLPEFKSDSFCRERG
jgi:hypothetical protein